MKLFNWLFTKPEEEPKQEQQWTIQNNGWEQSKNDYNKRMGLGETLI